MQATGSRKATGGTRASVALARPGLGRTLALNAIGLGVLWFIYSAVRTVTADSFSVARENADRLIEFQNAIGLPSEAVVQRFLLDYEWLVRSANVYYFAAHFPAMLAFLLWAMFAKREHMPRIRWALIGSTTAGLVVHLAFPLAPPRMLRLSGFVDTASLFGPDPYALGIAKAANELAAMPSMHVGWALLIAMAVISVSSSRWRWAILAHPLITTAVVVVTANHYWTDVIAGAALATLGWWISGIRRPTPVLEADVVDDPESFASIDLVEDDLEDCPVIL
ncbi:MAG: phosphatase PAP2 family protein [Actinomycetota bacterium]